jgi:putative nucleotidyltransferase with HDIG domain
MNAATKWRRHAQSAVSAAVPAQLLILAATAAFLLLLFPFPSITPLFDLPREGEIASETIIAPFTFDVEKLPQKLDEERKAAASKVLLVLDFNQDAAKLARRKLIDARTAVTSPSEKAAKSSYAAQSGKELSESALRTIKKYPVLIDEALVVISQALEKGILAGRINVEQNPSSSSQGASAGNDGAISYEKEFVTLRKNSYESTIRATDIPTKDRAVEWMVNRLKSASHYDGAELSALYELLGAYTQPDVFINEPETAVRKEQAAQDVLPIKGKVLQETELVRKHQVVTADVVEKLYSYRKAQEQIYASGERMRTRQHNIGALLLIVLSLLFIAFYIRSFHKPLLLDNKKLMAIACILLVQAGIIRLGLLIDTKVVETLSGAASLAPEYIIPTSVGAILAAIFFDLRVSFSVSMFTSIFISMALGSNYPLLLTTALSGFIAGYVTKNIRYRFDFVKAVPPMFAIYAFMILIIDLINCRFSLAGLLQNWGIAAVNCSAAVFIAMVLTMAFEYLFDIASNMTLIELADMNHPILKRLSIEAAGTYNHSVLVGNLAESAAERIGGNSLFVRVASYYHDIGKIEKAGYFIENMTAHEKSKHTKLSPNLSALIISAHVKEGAELARRYKLPRVIRDAIMQHHGTSTVSYFYEKAREQDPHNLVQEEQFRYTGPLPQTRENAIIMLADAVEAASRSLATSSPKLLRDLVKKIIRDKFSSAQLDQSNLTLRDLDEIVEGFMPILQGIFHTRDTITKERR